LRATNVLQETAWAKSKAGLAQLHLYRGATLSLTGDPAQIGFRLLEEDFAEGMEVKELRNLKGPEWTLVTDFYRLWAGSTNSRPTNKELEQAAELIAQHGQTKAKALIPLVVKRLKEKWPDAKSFGAIARYLPVVAGEYDRQQWNLEKRKQEQLQEQQEWEEAARKAKERAALQAVWETLPQEEREGIRTLVLAGQPQSLAKHPGLVDKLCLTELAKRRSEPAS
jgi:hypothetical protein